LAVILSAFIVIILTADRWWENIQNDPNWQLLSWI